MNLLVLSMNKKLEELFDNYPDMYDKLQKKADRKRATHERKIADIEKDATINTRTQGEMRSDPNRKSGAYRRFPTTINRKFVSARAASVQGFENSQVSSPGGPF